MENLIEELRWRGLIQDIIPGTEEELIKEPITAYVGFDPTADSLHIGSLIPIIVLVHFAKISGISPSLWLEVLQAWWAILRAKVKRGIY